MTYLSVKRLIGAWLMTVGGALVSTSPFYGVFPSDQSNWKLAATLGLVGIMISVAGLPLAAQPKE